ncbi:unnamed protein product [Caenorhabditis angaria]|uniref:Exosome complex component RRP45 n=1 Tax=Caenorhabditis angaria TaxID=860376 RepID=A0A9P1N3A7_9PELO|nr:unnamed protein product [Caenorhabditis angaria]
MRTQPLTICEKTLIVESLRAGKRLDFRSREEFRNVKLIVGSEIGTAICSIGQTKVICAVSAEITEPSSMRPQKGVINIDVDLSPMANYSHEHDRMGQKGMELTRLLELIIRDSRCIDVESLCIRAGKEVWKIKVDVRILDEDGSILDCACLAAITALQHFKRPNVTLEPHHTLVYSEYEKSPIPLNIYHMPICTTIGLLDKGSTIIIDPTEKESECLDGTIVVACNKRKEVCALHQSTNLILTTKQIENCVKLAMSRAEELSSVVIDVIRQDQRERSAFKRPSGFAITSPAIILNENRVVAQQIRAPIKMEIEQEEIEEEESEKQRQAYQSSVIMNENPLRSDGVKQEEIDEEQMIDEQLANIQQSVNRVELDNKQSLDRHGEIQEVDDLLAGLGDDDEEEESTVVTLGDTVDEEDEIVLVAKKKRF